jgi:hypothetical protein
MCVISTITTNSVLIGSVDLGHAHAGVASLKPTYGMSCSSTAINLHVVRIPTVRHF